MLSTNPTQVLILFWVVVVLGSSRNRVHVCPTPAFPQLAGTHAIFELPHINQALAKGLENIVTLELQLGTGDLSVRQRREYLICDQGLEKDGGPACNDRKRALAVTSLQTPKGIQSVPVDGSVFGGTSAPPWRPWMEITRMIHWKGQLFE